MYTKEAFIGRRYWAVLILFSYFEVGEKYGKNSLLFATMLMIVDPPAQAFWASEDEDNSLCRQNEPWSRHSGWNGHKEMLSGHRLLYIL